MIGCFVIRSDMAGGTISVWILRFRLLGDTSDSKELITWEVLSLFGGNKHLLAVAFAQLAVS
jgi:hypothetical protein